MHDNYFTTADEVNTNLFAGSLSPDQAKMIYEDPIYGLNNKTNYVKWDPLVLENNKAARRQIKNEIRFYFGCTSL